MISRLLLRALDNVDPDRRRCWSIRIVIWTCLLWAVSHIGLIYLPPWFFEHVLLAISYGAIVISAIDVVSTTDVRANEDP